MKISQFIEELQKIYDNKGDIDLHAWEEGCGCCSIDGSITTFSINEDKFITFNVAI